MPGNCPLLLVAFCVLGGFLPFDEDRTKHFRAQMSNNLPDTIYIYIFYAFFYTHSGVVNMFFCIP